MRVSAGFEGLRLVKKVNFHYRHYNRFNPDNYKYQFDVKPDNLPWKEFFGSTHASDVIYLFGKEKFRKEFYRKWRSGKCKWNTMGKMEPKA